MSWGILNFSDLLKMVNSRPTLKYGCLVDTSVLFAYAYPNDRFNKPSSELFEYLLSLRGSDAKVWMTGAIEWADMVNIIGRYGIGSSDAMIVNLFMNSYFDGIFTADIEMAKAISKISNGKKLVFVPDKIAFQ